MPLEESPAINIRQLDSFRRFENDDAERNSSLEHDFDQGARGDNRSRPKEKESINRFQFRSPRSAPAAYFFVWILLIRTPLVASNWLYLAIHNPNSSPLYYNSNHLSTRSLSYPQQYCDSLTFLNEQQRRLCAQFPFVLSSVGVGAREAVHECQWQFKFERWNCTAMRTANDTEYDLFENVLRTNNRETAYLNAISSAGLTHAVTRACSQGNLTDCSCDMTKHGEAVRDRNNEKWHWGGCSDNVRYGFKFGQDFLDRHERLEQQRTKLVRHLVNLHNYEVGRKAISEHMKRQCRCHGVSGSCEFKTCWQAMPKFSEVGEFLKSAYDHNSVHVAKRARKRLRRKEKSERKIAVRPGELVYLAKSPNYCDRDYDRGVYGTIGRQCNKTSLRGDGCDLLCCGRGFNMREDEISERCHCKFVWCCDVKCKTCTSKVQVFTCK